MWDWLNIEKPLRWLTRQLWEGNRQIMTLRPVWAIEEDTVSKKRRDPGCGGTCLKSQHLGRWRPRKGCSICFQCCPTLLSKPGTRAVARRPASASSLKFHLQHLHPNKKNKTQLRSNTTAAPAALAGLQQWEQERLTDRAESRAYNLLALGRTNRTVE